ncbi:hypothetical protein BE221DRAFT_72100 [Ostreococcus tauri]|uniref:Protein ENHANCED DISEASE RESISTANCE 2 C-terminal domain-containing protein n=1 Tax=Ostreococcus tauri TaxID=70448 RepID=A0A1Y5IJE8_OSTTA|nr:hypothetical protein BE221DRAFT_72100 [Ostreococcus tauri]
MGAACSRSTDASAPSHLSSPPSSPRRRSIDAVRRSIDTVRDALGLHKREHQHWSETSCPWLSVRSETYDVDRAKTPVTRPMFMTLKHCDLFDQSDLKEGERLDVARRTAASWFRKQLDAERDERGKDGVRKVPWTFVFQFVNPDGAGLVCYFQPAFETGEGDDAATTATEVAARVERDAEASGLDADHAFARLFRRFLLEDNDNDAFRSERIKICAKITKGPAMLTQLVPTRPVLVGKRARTVFHSGKGTDLEGRYLECDCICADNSYAKYLYYTFSGLSSRSEEDVAIWIEGRGEDELPERVLGAVKFRKISPKTLTKV